MHAWYTHACLVQMDGLHPCSQALGATATALLMLRMVDPDNNTILLRSFCFKQIFHVLICGGGTANLTFFKGAVFFQALGAFYYLFDSAPNFDFLQKSETHKSPFKVPTPPMRRFPRHITAPFAPSTVGPVR